MLVIFQRMHLHSIYFYAHNCKTVFTYRKVTKYKIENSLALKTILELLILAQALRNKPLKKINTYLLILIIVSTQQHNHQWTEIVYFYSKVKQSGEKNVHRPNRSTRFWLLKNIHNILHWVYNSSQLTCLNVHYICAALLIYMCGNI